MRRILGTLLLAVGLFFGIFTGATPAQASVTPGNAALNWAESHALGHWYGWGGVGPSVFDCSGLVYASAMHTGTNLGSARTTYAMIASWHLVRIPLSQAKRGDLLFFGSGHVEINTVWYHTSFGAQQSGTRVGWHKWSGWWAPTMAFRLR